METIKSLEKSNGSLKIPFGRGKMYRNSTAWHPDTGEAVRNHVPRITENKIPVFNFEPEVFYTFTEPEIFMDYASGVPQGTSKWMTGTGGRQEEFENAYPQFEKLIFGQSEEGRDLIAYRLGINGCSGVAASGTKHVFITSVVHGNEVDGQNGLFKAMEIIADNPRFQNFREEWTLVFVPACNPDGYYHYTRNLRVQGSDGKYVNLNRNWDWFWSEFTPSDSESKGDSAMDSKEATALNDYRVAIEECGGYFGACCDFHSTSGQPCRYQSRDRQYNMVTGAYNGTENVPSGRIAIPMEWYVRGIYQAGQTLRAHTANGKDLFLRYYRSSQKPHMHPYWTSKGAFAVAVEEAKVDKTRPDYETVASACNHRLDYCLSFCSAVTADNWLFEDAVLIEPATTNVLKNANWAGWQDKSRLRYDPEAEERPSYYSRSRMITNRVTKASGIKHFKDNGEAVKIKADIDISLPSVSEFNSIGHDGDNTLAVVCSSGSVYSIPSERQNSKTIINSLHYHTSPVGTAVCSTLPVFSGATTAIDVLGGGDGRFTGATSIITRIDTDEESDSTVREYRIEDDAGGSGTGFTARAFAGYAENFLDSPSDANKKCWLFGGMDDSNNYLNTIGWWEQQDKTFSAATVNLPSGMIGCACAYDTTTNNIYIFGGQTASGYSNRILKYDTGADTIEDLSTSLPSGTAFAAATYMPSEARIYVYGGETNGDEYSKIIYEFEPVYYVLKRIYPAVLNLTDFEDDEQNATYSWSTDRGNWTAATLQADEDNESVTLIGGRGSDGVHDDIYKHSITDDTISTLETFSFGYFRYSTLISSGSISDNTVGCEKFSLSVFVKSAPDNDKGYYRTAIHTNDTNGPNSSVGQRYIRNFYTIAPKQFYKWYHTRVDLNEGNELDWEDGIRIFSRIYNDGYESIVDGIHVHAGDTLPMSYQHQDETRAKETFTFPVSVNPNSFKISFYWQAIASFVDIHEDLELMRVNIDSNNYIRLVALAGTRWQRQYRTYDVHGPHDPKFEIQKYVSGTKVASASIVCYWNYDLRGGSIEPQDEVLKFTIEHFADDYLMLRINKYGFEGRKSVAPSASEFSTNSAEIKYNGHGWYSKPTIYNTATLENGRKIPARRKGVLSRIREADRDCCMIGERDPDNGNQIEDTCYSQGEFWKYPDQTVIGANWKSGSDPYYSVGGGWRVESSGVICTGSGIARWDLYPRHQDIIIKGNVSTDTDGNRVGLLGRFDDNLRQTGYSASGVTAYGAELKQTGSSSAEVRIMKWWYGTDTELVKDTLSSYTADENLELIFTLQGSGLTAEIAGRGSCSIGDTQLQKPRRVGIYGIAESSTVTMDDFHVRPNFASGVLE